jgi:hypothetical protein
LTVEQPGTCIEQGAELTMSNPTLEAMREELAKRYAKETVEPVELGRVRDYLLAMDEPADIEHGSVVPPLFLLSFGRTRRPQPAKGAAVKVGDEYAFLAPVHVGDTLTITSRLAGIEVKQGKRGTMYLATAEWSFRNQQGQQVAVAKTRSMRWD